MTECTQQTCRLQLRNTIGAARLSGTAAARLRNTMATMRFSEAVTTQLRLNVAAAMGAAMLAMACAMALVCGTAVAYADEGDGENVVNPQQLPDSSFIYDTSIADLATADTYFDNQTVQVVGEVVGDNIAATPDGRHRWITLANTDGSANVAVYMSSESAAKIDRFGAYGVTGTTLQVRGTFHLVCSEHDGVTDLHAEVVSVVSAGRDHPDTFEYEKFLPGLVAVVIGLIMLLVFYILRERQR